MGNKKNLYMVLHNDSCSFDCYDSRTNHYYIVWLLDVEGSNGSKLCDKTIVLNISSLKIWF